MVSFFWKAFSEEKSSLTDWGKRKKHINNLEWFYISPNNYSSVLFQNSECWHSKNVSKQKNISIHTKTVNIWLIDCPTLTETPWTPRHPWNPPVLIQKNTLSKSRKFALFSCQKNHRFSSFMFIIVESDERILFQNDFSRPTNEPIQLRSVFPNIQSYLLRFGVFCLPTFWVLVISNLRRCDRMSSFGIL